MEHALPAAVAIEAVPTWTASPPVPLATVDGNDAARSSPFPVDPELNDRFSLWQGDQLALEVDAVVNATSEQFNDRSFFTKRLATLAGPDLGTAIARLDGCRTGEAKITPGFNLHARYIVHTVGPRYNARYKTAAENALHSCYRGCVQVAKENRLRTIAFCVINSEKRGYPRDEGAHIALRTLRRCMEHFKADFDRVVFCLDNEADMTLYASLLALYFPRNAAELRAAAAILPTDCGNEWGETVIEERVIRVGNLGGGSSEDEGDDDGDVAASWLSPQDKSEEKKNALTVMSPAKEERSSTDAGLSPEDEETERRYVSFLQRAQTTDLSEFDKYGVVYHSGRDADGRPIVVVAPCRLPEPLPDMDKLALYVLRVLDPLVNSDYVLIYFHSHMSDRTKPDFSWLKMMYELFSWKYSRNLQRFYVVHPTFWLKLVNAFFRAFASAEFFEKVTYLDSLTDLFQRIPRSQLTVHPDIYRYDRDECGTVWPTETGAAAQHTESL
jgi:O-acetyl-ADP-ribose deacetylase (regulator of RNase III)